ncbi:ATP-binding protein [Clostridia bacterium OttesenSCG-928-F22]|nr:ATP-binding protein [Clostridia bacterium OttesenSCG-928-F22]
MNQAEYFTSRGFPPLEWEVIEVPNAAYQEVFTVKANDFVSAGEASSQIKKTLKQLGVTGDVLRRIAVASYEAEINLVIHTLGGQLHFEVSPPYVTIISKDVGPGIADVSLAMQEGYSTANEDVRMMGFGAGMGLPNMRRCADEFDIQSTVGKGTSVTMRFKV